MPQIPDQSVIKVLSYLIVIDHNHMPELPDGAVLQVPLYLIVLDHNHMPKLPDGAVLRVPLNLAPIARPSNAPAVLEHSVSTEIGSTEERKFNYTY